MEHVKDIELIELVAQRLEPDREKAVRRHLESCPACRDKLAELQSTWGLLGAWEVSPAAHRGAETAVSPEPRAEPVGSQRVFRLSRWGMVVRVAASVVVAAAIGYVGGWHSVGPVAAAESSEPPEYISALSLEVGESFSSLVFEDEPVAGEEGDI